MKITRPKIKLPVALVLGAILSTLAACGSSGSDSTSTSTSSSADSTTGGDTASSGDSTTGGGTASGGTATGCVADITAGSALGILSIPDDSASGYKTNFCKYTKLDAPNGKPIHFYAQDGITNEQMVRARRILEFYLTNVPNSQYGADKTAVWNQMANNNATLIMLNGSDGDSTVPNVNGQTLYATENVVEGTAAYLVNNPRDAAFEEILHMMHDTGIGVDFAGAAAGVLSQYQAEIRAATNNAAPSSLIAGGQGIWASGAEYQSWLTELQAEGSLTQEYLAAIIDTYYGLAGDSSAQTPNTIYKPQTRAQIQTMDPMGWALVGSDSPRKYFSEFVTYKVRVDPAYTGTFSMVFDSATKYTYKSQYLSNVALTGGLSTNLTGNDRDNQLWGNQGDNVITGGKGNDVIDGDQGSDTAVFSGASTEYTITTSGGQTTVTDNVAGRDGMDTLTNVELLTFSDTSVSP